MLFVLCSCLPSRKTSSVKARYVPSGPVARTCVKFTFATRRGRAPTGHLRSRSGNESPNGGRSGVTRVTLEAKGIAGLSACGCASARDQAEPQVRSDAFLAVESPSPGIRDGEHADVVDRTDGSTEQDGCDVGEDAVDHSGTQKGASQGRAALD